MAQTIKLKRSATQNAVPSTSQLALGEVAINTYDGKMYIKKNDGSDSIVEIGGDATSSSGLDFTGNLNLADDVRIVIGDGNDLQIWHGGVDSYVRNYTGNLQFIQGADDKDIQFYCDDGSGGHAEYLRMDGSAGTIVASKNLHFGDNVFLNMGADNDLQIFHNGSNSVIKDAGTGNLSLQTNGSTINMWNSSAQNYIGQFNANAVTLYHGGNEKFKTTSTGATVTGTMLADAGKLTGSGFTTLTVNSTRTSGNIGGMNFTASDTLKGQIFGSVEGELKFAVNGSTEAMRIDAGGRLLINTTTSIDNLSQLHIVGPTSGRAGITLQDGDSTTQKTFFTQDGGSTRFNTQNGTSHGSFVVGGWNGTASVDLLRVTGDGRVGIGTNAPAKELHIASSQPDILLQDTDGTNQTSEITSSGGNLFLGSRNDTANGLIIFRGLGGGTGDEYARFNSNGKLGIGTTSPTYLLDVQSSVGGILARFKDTDSSHTGIVIAGDTNAGWVGNNALATGEGIYYQSSLNAMRMYTNGSEAMRIDSSGRVGIGETSPVQKLQVNGNIRADGHYYVGGLIVIDSSRNLTNIGTVTASGIVNIGGGTSYYSEKLLVQGRTRVAGQLDIAAGTGYGNYAKFTHDDTELEIATVRSAGTNGQIVLSPLGTAALTLDTSQNATFAGNITMTGNQLKIISSTDSNLGWMIRDNTYVTDEMDITSTRLGTGNQPTLGLAGQNGINFYVAGTNVGSFNSSGHLLVGKSSTGVNTNGIEARTDGLLAASRDQNPALYVTRTTDAGDIAKFYSGTTSVGSIGTINNILTIGSGSTGIIFNPNASPNASIYPWNVGTNSASDSAIDLGISTRRWQDLYLSGTIYGGSTLTLDPAAHGDDTGTVVIAGNLQVDGTTTTINSTTLTVDDKNITLASGSTNAAAANGAGLTVDCGSDADATFTYDGTNDEWDFNKNINITGAVVSSANGAITTASGTTARFSVSETGGATTAMDARGSTGNIGTRSNHTLGFLVNDVQKATLTAGGDFTVTNDIKVTTTNPRIDYDGGNSGALRFYSTSAAQERMRITSGGNVGIGTTSPSAALHVRKDNNVTTTVETVGDFFPSTRIKRSGGSTKTNYEWEFQIGSSGNLNFKDITNSYYPIILNTAGDVRLSSDTSGQNPVMFVQQSTARVGIGTTTPDSLLEISSASATDFVKLTSTGSSASPIKLIFEKSGSEQGVIEYNRNGNLELYNTDPDGGVLISGSASADGDFYITHGGNVGIGTTSPDTPLHVFSSGTTQAKFVRDLTTDVGLTIGNDNSGVVFGTIGVHNYQFYANGARRLNISSTGAATFNEAFTFPTSDGSANQVLKTDGSGNVTWATEAAVSANTSISDADGDTKIQVEESSDEDVIRFDTAGTQRMVIDSGGNFGFGVDTPSNYFHVKKNSAGIIARIEGTAGRYLYTGTDSGGHYLEQVGTSATERIFRIQGSNGSGTYTVLSLDGHNQRIYTSSNVNVGIGTTSPSQKLQVAGTILADTALAASSGNDAIGIGSESTITDTSSTYRIKLVSNSNSAKLTTYSYGSYLTLKAGVDGTNYANNWSKIELRDGGGVGANNAHMKFYTHGDERMVIDNYGNVGIGTNNPVDNYAAGITPESTKLAVVGANVSGYTEVAHFAAGTDSDNTGATVRIGHVGNDRGMFIKAGRGTSNQAKALLGVRNSANTDSNILTLQEGGNVGIGTTAPNSTLHISDAGTSSVTSFNANGRITMRGDGVLNWGSSADSGALTWNTGRAVVYGKSGKDLYLGAGDAQDHLVIKTDGKVGIGTTSPGRKLTVQGGSGDNLPLRIIGGSGTSHGSMEFQDPNTTADYKVTIGSKTDDFYIQAGGTEKVRVLANGNVGIGTASPETKLDVIVDSNSAYTSTMSGVPSYTPSASDVIQVKNTESGVDNIYAGIWFETGNPATNTTGTNRAGRIALVVDNNTSYASNFVFQTRGSAGTLTEKMRITEGGKVGIGTTSPDTKLDIDGLVNGGIAFTATQVEIDRQSLLPNGRIFYNDSRLIYDSPANGHRFAVAGNQGTNLALEIYSNRDIGFYNSSGAADLFWDASTSRLGIGTTSPSQALHVVGTIYTSGTGGNGYFEGHRLILESTSTYANIGSSAYQISNVTNEGLAFGRSSSRMMLLDTSGNLGIGTTSPEAKLHTVGHSRLDGAMLQKSNLSIASANISTDNEYISHNGPILTNGSTGNINQYGYFRGYQAVYGDDGTNGFNPYAQGAYSKPVFEFISNNRGSISLPTDAAIRSGYLYQFVLGNNGSGSNSGVELTSSNTTVLWGITSSNHAYFANSVGIGTSSPAKTLDVAANGSSQGIHLNISGVGRLQMYADGNRNYFKGLSGNGHRFTTTGGANVEILNNGNVGIGTTSPVAKLQVEELGIDTTTTTTSATTQVAIDTMAAATFRSAEFTIQVTNSTDSTYHLTKVLLIHDGTTPGITEYGTVFTGSAAEATFDADISSGNVRLLATPASTDSMTFKVVRHCITV